MTITLVILPPIPCVRIIQELCNDQQFSAELHDLYGLIYCAKDALDNALDQLERLAHANDTVMDRLV